MSHQKLTLVTTLAIALGTAVLAAHAQDKMYFTGNGNGPDKIRRANLDGRKKEDLVVGLGAPGGIALDTAGGKMYWTNSCLLYTSPSPRDRTRSRMPSSA